MEAVSVASPIAICPSLGGAFEWQHDFTGCTAVFSHGGALDLACPSCLHHIDIQLPLHGVVQVFATHYRIWGTERRGVAYRFWVLDRPNVMKLYEKARSLPLAKASIFKGVRRIGSGQWSLDNIRELILFLANYDQNAIGKLRAQSILLIGILQRRLGICHDLTKFIAQIHFDMEHKSVLSEL